MSNTTTKELEEVLNDPILTNTILMEKSNYQYKVALIKWSWNDKYSVCVADSLEDSFVDSPFMDESEALSLYNTFVKAFRIA